MKFVELIAKEFSNMFDNLVNSCSTYSDINFAKIMCQNFITKNHVGLNIKVEDLTVEEYREIQDLVMCHAVVHIAMIE